MKRMLKFLTLALVAGLIFTSCGKDDPKPTTISGEALFSYVADGLKVTFTNTSTVSGAYTWDFGDSATATDKDPVHTYASKGTYSVKLTVKDSNGDNHDITTSISVDKTSPVVLGDGSFADWASISDAFTPGEGAGTIKSFKYDFDKDFIYFYIKEDVSTAVAPFTDAVIFDMLIDTNPDDTTGYKYSIWPLYTGAELLVENSFSNTKDNEDLFWLDFANYKASGMNWEEKWIYDSAASSPAEGAVVDGTYLVTGNVIEAEFAISRQKIVGLKDVNKISIVAWVSDQEWEEIGWIPNKATTDNPEVGGLVIDMN